MFGFCYGVFGLFCGFSGLGFELGLSCLCLRFGFEWWFWLCLGGFGVDGLRWSLGDLFCFVVALGLIFVLGFWVFGVGWWMLGLWVF